MVRSDEEGSAAIFGGYRLSKKGGWAVFPITGNKFAVGCYVSGGGKRWKPKDVFDDEGQARRVLADRLKEKA